MKDKEGLVLCKTICLQWYCTYEKGNMCNVRVFSVTKANQKEDDLKSSGFKVYLRNLYIYK